MLGRSRSQHSSSAWVKAWRISIWAVFGSVRIIGCHVTLSICLCRWSRSLKYFLLLAGKCSWLRGQSQRMRPVVTLGPGSQCQCVSAPGARTSSPHACQLSLSLESFSAECSWCGQHGDVSFPRRWVGDVIVRDCRPCVAYIQVSVFHICKRKIIVNLSNSAIKWLLHCQNIPSLLVIKIWIILLQSTMIRNITFITSVMIEWQSSGTAMRTVLLKPSRRMKENVHGCYLQWRNFMTMGLLLTYPFVRNVVHWWVVWASVKNVKP